MSEYAELQSQIAALQKRADAMLQAERKVAIKTINELVAAFAIARNEIKFSGAVSAGTQPKASGARKPHPSAGKSVPPRFRDTKGNSWSGRGMRPKWLREAIAAGAAIESFRIE